MLTRRTWFERETPVPFAFKRGQCFLCTAPAVRHIADEPVCAHHAAVIDDIRREAEERVA